MTLLRRFVVVFAVCSQVLGVAAARVAGDKGADLTLEVAEQPDLTGYPRVSLFARILDSDQQPIPQISSEDLVVTEDQQTVGDLALAPAALGLNVAFVVSAGEHPERVGETGQAVAEEARAAIRLFANDYMRSGDTVAIWSMEGERAVSVQAATGVASDVNEALDAFSLRPSTTITPALEAALDSFATVAASTPSRRLIVVLAPGWRDRPDPALIERIDTLAVVVNGVLTRRGLDLNTGLSDLTARPQRPGLFVHYTGPQSLRSLYGAWNAGRDGYRLAFDSPTGAPGSHQVAIQLVGSDAGATLTYLAPVPAGPQIAFTSHQPGFQTGRLARELIGVSVATPPGTPAVDRAELFVNTVSLGVLEGPGPYAWAWDPAPYGELLAAEGESAGPVELRVQVTDATGQMTAAAIRGQALFVAIDACTAYRGLPAIGRGLYGACRSTGLTPPLVALFILVLAVAGALVWLWRHRGAVSTAGQQMGRRLTDVYRRLTRTGGRRTPLAYLDVIEGLDPGARTSFDLFGQTPIGRSRDYAELCFHADRQRSPISGLHCTLHDDEGSGNWSLEDEDSTNGTYVNGVRLPGLGQRAALHDGDVVELAQVERGGLKFRFRLAAAPTPDGARSAVTPGARRATGPARETRPLVATRGPAVEPDVEFDPRRNDF